MEDNTIEIEIPSRSSIPDKVPSVSMYVVASIRSMSVYIYMRTCDGVRIIDSKILVQYRRMIPITCLCISQRH